MNPTGTQCAAVLLWRPPLRSVPMQRMRLAQLGSIECGTFLGLGRGRAVIGHCLCGYAYVMPSPNAPARD
jgi:hypothetical protein